MYKYLSNNVPTHNRFVDANIGNGKFIKYIRPSKWLINNPNAHILNVWKCIYNDPNELSNHIKSENFESTCAYGNAGLYLYQRDFENIHMNNGGFNEYYFKENIYNVNKFMNSTQGDMTNVSITNLIDHIDIHDFVYLDDRENKHKYIVDNDYIDAIDKNGANIMILKDNSDPELHRKFKRHNVTFLNKDKLIVTNY